MKTKSYSIYFAAVLLILAGCMERNDKTASSDINGHLCRAETAFTKQEIGHYIIKIFEPNEKQNPDIWQGPLCVINRQNGKKCGFDLSLIKGVTVTKDEKYIDVGVFSGSNARDYRIELESCIIKLQH